MQGRAEYVAYSAEALALFDALSDLFRRIPAAAHGRVDVFPAVKDLGAFAHGGYAVAQYADMAQKIFNVGNIRRDLLLRPQSAAAALDQYRRHSAGARVTVKAVFCARAHRVVNADVHRHLLRAHADLRSRAAVKINVRGEVFVASAGVEVDDVVAAADDALLKKRRELFRVRAAGAAGKNAVEVFAVGGENVRAATYEPVVIEGVDKVQLTADALRLKLACKLYDSLNTDVFAAVNSRRDRHARTLVRPVNDGFGVLQPRSGHGNEAADLFTFSHAVLSP